MKKIILPLIVVMALMAFQTTPSKKAVTKPVAASANNSMSASLNRGKNIYLLRCLACHQADGGGVPHLNAPLDGASAVVGKDKAKLIKIVLKGMSDRVEIDGEYYSNNMLALADLSNQEIADVLTYVRNNWTNKATAVTVAEVKAVRAKIK